MADVAGDSGTAGLREEKKRLTRETIAAAAMRLFTEHGFDAVTIAQIAEAARVSEKTVYNYFPRKTGLFFDEADSILAELLFTIANRKPGQSALGAVREFLAGRAEWAGGRRPPGPTRGFRDLIAQSHALQAGMRDMFARYESALASLLAAETGAPAGSAGPFVAAVALVALVRAPFETSAQGQRPGQIPEDAMALLSAGLAGYAVAGR